MFHLLVKSNGWASARDSLGKDRVFEYTGDDLSEQFMPGGKPNSDAISRLPAIFLSESDGSDSQLARVGFISRTGVSGRLVSLQYSFEADIAPIPNKILESFAGELDIEDFEFHRTHWAIKDADLFKTLLKARAAQRIKPKVFRIDELSAVDKDLISIMMPFASDFDKVYAALKGMAKDLRMKCSRADDIWDHDVVIQDIVSLIERSRLVICDCTGRNPNVFYEIGIAHTLGKDVVLITQSKDDIPFDLRHLRYVTYLNNAEGRRKLVAKVSERIENLGV